MLLVVGKHVEQWGSRADLLSRNMIEAVAQREQRCCSSAQMISHSFTSVGRYEYLWGNHVELTVLHRRFYIRQRLCEQREGGGGGFQILNISANRLAALKEFWKEPTACSLVADWQPYLP